MENSFIKSLERKRKRVLRIRNKIHGTAERPRMCVTKSNRNLSVQMIDDDEGKTLVCVTTLSKKPEKSVEGTKNKETAGALGSKLASLCEELKIKKAVLDRRGHKYHGVIAALADAARKNGLDL